MVRIILMCAVLIVSSCSNANQQNCKIVYIDHSQNDDQENLDIDLRYLENKRILELSVLNLGQKVLYFSIPTVMFSPIKDINENDGNEDVVTKRYIPFVYVSKSICYLQKDNQGSKKIISIDSTMQRNELKEMVRIEHGEKFTKEFYLDCDNSDKGEYEIYFLEKSEKDDATIKIRYPEGCVLKVEK